MWDRIRYRRLQALTLVLLSALITTCAVFAPLYQRAMQQALTRVDLERTSVAVRGLQVSAIPETGYVTEHTPTIAPAGVAALVPAEVRRSYRAPIAMRRSLVVSAARTPTYGTVEWRRDQCLHVTFLSGRCPTAADEVAVSAADEKNYGTHPGTAVLVQGESGDARAEPQTVRLRVVGLYRQTRDDYWFGALLTGSSGVVEPVTNHKLRDTWLTPESTFTSAAVPRLPAQTNEVDYPLDVAHTRVDQLLALQPALGRLKARVRSAPASGYIDTYSGLPDIARDVRHQSAQSRITVPLLMVQLGILALIVLWLVLAAATEQRRPEIAIAMLRGRGRQGSRGLLTRELLPVIASGVPVGIVAAFGLSWLTRDFFLPGSAPAELRLGTVLAATLAALALVVLTVAATRAVTRQPVEQLLRRVPVRRAGWSLGTVEALVVAVAAASSVAFVTGSLSGPIALAAPTLLALMVGLLLARASTPLATALGSRLLARGRVSLGAGLLETARTPATRRAVAVVTVAAALLVFSATTLAVGARNRTFAAEQKVGAPLRATLRGNDLAGLRSALRSVDPRGTSVTPVVSMQLPSGKVRTQAVLPAPFRKIALHPGLDRSPVDPSRLAPPALAPTRLTGDGYRVRLTASGVSSTAPGLTPPVSLALNIVTAANESLAIPLGNVPLGSGTTTRAVSGGLPCERGCVVSGVSLQTLPVARVRGTLVLSGLRTTSDDASPVNVALGPGSSWTTAGDAGHPRMAPSTRSDGGLGIAVASSGSSTITMHQNWLPARIPALVSGALSEQGAADFTATGLDRRPRGAVRVGSVPRVAGSGPETALVNLDVLQRGSTVEVLDEISVWFARDDPALVRRVSHALAARGIQLGPTASVAQARIPYDDSTAAWGLALGVVVGVAGLLLAMLVVLVLAATTWRTRSRDLAALRMSGVGHGRVRSMATTAQLPLLAVACVAGTLCGVLGAHFALPVVPLFAAAPSVSTLDLGIPWLLVAALGLGALVVILVTGWLTGAAISRRAQLDRIRESI